jgi:hypothetical protein
MKRERLEWINLTQNMDQWRSLVSATVSSPCSDFMKGGEVFNKLNDNQFIVKNYATWY